MEYHKRSFRRRLLDKFKRVREVDYLKEEQLYILQNNRGLNPEGLRLMYRLNR